MMLDKLLKHISQPEILQLPFFEFVSKMLGLNGFTVPKYGVNQFFITNLKEIMQG
jgi:hypothetical protein